MFSLSPVRKHRAPKGALRRAFPRAIRAADVSQKAPSAKRCIKTRCDLAIVANVIQIVRKHRAPKGALRPWRRCRSEMSRQHVRKHRAPKGALRRFSDIDVTTLPVKVRKHRAPKGALRHAMSCSIFGSICFCQKAPSAKRCIKTISQLAIS